MGTDYLTSIENAAERMGNADAEANLKSVWHKPTSQFGEWFSTDKKTESKVYLKLQLNSKQIACKTTTTYYLDGHLATDEEVAEIEVWMKKKNHTISSTQAEMGIDAEHEQTFLLMQLDTIISIKQGERELSPATMLAAVVAAR